MKLLEMKKKKRGRRIREKRLGDSTSHDSSAAASFRCYDWLELGSSTKKAYGKPALAGPGFH